MSAPLKVIAPWSQNSAPEMQLIMVVLPEPFGPMRPRRSPSSEIKVHRVERNEPAEALGQAFDGEDALSHGSSPSHAGR